MTLHAAANITPWFPAHRTSDPSSRISMPGTGDATTWERTGQAVQVHDAADLVAWIHPGTDRTASNAQKLRVLYQMLIEVMANTREHAGPDVTWRLRADVSRRAGACSVAVTFADGGRGIVSTLRGRRGLVGTDEEVLRQSLLDVGPGSCAGQFRGRGLASLRRSVDEGLVHEAAVVANGASIRLASHHAVAEASKVSFAGTLVAWRMTLESGR